ncbi:MAG TPA: CPBP family intramembrane metalloprotease [Anaerolineales bacterium]|nr:CPBP family intramembrane metalloprotease [Anaerolineales bacterium]HNN13560.1 CPBP family intramembrane metalloprotease [Anaerolineales bacterium]HNO32063.1 CPBP family intramembrane metalloprotease [Anaerolineales bacterium]
MNKKWFAPVLPYLAVWVGLFVFKNVWLALVGFHLAIGLALILLRATLPFDTLIKNQQRGYILASMLICILSGLGLLLLWNVLGVANDLHEQLIPLGLNERTWAGFIAYFTLVNPWVEEYFWRGVLGSDTSWIYIGDLIFAGYHTMILWEKVPFSSILIALVALVFAGWFWRQLYWRDGGLLAPVLGHMAADLSILLVVYTLAG